MAAPTVTAVGVPLGRKLRRAYKTRFALGVLPTFSLFDFAITPGEWTIGQPIPQSTFLNTRYMTWAPQALIDIGPFIIRGQFDPDVFKTAQLPTIIGAETAATHHWVGFGQLAMFGFVTNAAFTEAAVNSNDPPMITLGFKPSNYDPVNNVEAGPAFTDSYTGTADT